MAARYLDMAGVKLVMERIVAGDGNAEIRRKLEARGHRPISANALSKYRQRSTVKRAIEKRDAAACQVGYAQFGARVSLLARHAEAIEARLYDRDGAMVPGKAQDMAPLCRELRDTLRDLSALLDRAKRPANVHALTDTEGQGAGYIIIDRAAGTDTGAALTLADGQVGDPLRQLLPPGQGAALDA